MLLALSCPLKQEFLVLSKICAMTPVALLSGLSYGILHQADLTVPKKTKNKNLIMLPQLRLHHL